ncbi:hypothetical protein [Vibrio mediterranei]|uniref:hypothetical protein n=1 Tax=Vibrio mediterranei TaxID=689 RepID=UPI00148E8115|nr:hypothetical protein [Vibrio mediterranei]MCG9658256.1 hypothetical protein [Vibrio mediterranei]NOI26795.1 hypothetical protein [Vibrio mediterranei]
MKVWLSLLLLIFAQLAHAEPAAFGIRINTTTLDEIKKTHQVTPIVSRDEIHNPAPHVCVHRKKVSLGYQCQDLPESVEHAYTVDIRDSGVQYFEVRTDDNGVVKFVLVDFENPNKGVNSRSLNVERHLMHKYRANYEYGLFQDGYLRGLYETTNAFVSSWEMKNNNFFFVMLSDKDYLKTTRYDLTPYYHPKGKSAADQF